MEIAKEAVAKEISDYFRERIRNGDLSPGTVLPSLQEVGEEFNADIHDVRDAMELLRDEHLVKTNNGIGTVVLADGEWKHMMLLLPDVENWHWQRIYKEISYQLNYRKWHLELKEHRGRPDLISSYTKLMANGDYFGAIMAVPLAMLKQDDVQFSRMIASGFPLVFIGGGLNCWSVDDMLYNCGYTGAKHLIEQGYKRIGIVASHAYDGEEFVAGCKKALEDAELQEAAIGYAENEDFALKMLELWLGQEKPPDALFYQRSDHGEKCFNLLKSKRIQIGPEMGFMALDDTSFHKLSIPGPTAIRRFPDSIGSVAVNLFLELVELPKKERMTAKRVNSEFRIEPGRSTQKGSKNKKIYYAHDPYGSRGMDEYWNTYLY